MSSTSRLRKNAACAGALTLAAGLAGCATRPYDVCESGARLSRDVQPILSAHCAGAECHGAQFSPGKTWSRIVGVRARGCADGRRIVEPGDPRGSYLHQKLIGDELCAGERMPRGRAPLDEADVAVIASWICGGARDD